MMTQAQQQTIRDLQLEYGEENVRITTDEQESTTVDITGSHAHRYNTVLHNGRLTDTVTIFDDFVYVVTYDTFAGVSHTMHLYVTDLSPVIASLTKQGATVTSVTPTPTATLTLVHDTGDHS